MRLFVGIWPPDDWVAALSEAQRSLRRLDTGRVLSFPSPDRLHLTVLFLGEVDPATLPAWLPELKTRLAALSLPVLRPGPFGRFPSAGEPRVLWAGVEGGSPELRALHECVEQVTRGCRETVRPEPFHPHLTLARVRRSVPTAWRPILEASAFREATWTAGDWIPTEVRVVASRMDEAKPRYECLASMPWATT